MVRTARSIAIFSLMSFLAWSIFLQAQQTLTSASITGRVLDPSGAVVPRASVSALQLATNESFTANTDDQGRFRFPYLPVGQYSIRAESTGFAPITRQLQLTVGAAFDLTFQLPLSQATENVQVTEQPPVIETDRSQVSETVDQTEVTNLPYEGRNYLDLSLLLPGVSPTNTASTQTLAETSVGSGPGLFREQPAQLLQQLHRRWAFGQRRCCRRCWERIRDGCGARVPGGDIGRPGRIWPRTGRLLQHHYQERNE